MSSQHCGGRRWSWGGRCDGGTDTEAERQPPAPTVPALGGAEVTARQLLTQPLRPAWELPGDLPPTVGVSLGTWLSRGCSLNTEDPGCGRGLLLGAGRAVITAGLSALVGGMVVACALCVCVVGGREESENTAFQTLETTDPRVIPMNGFCFSHTSWDRSLTTCSTWGQP